MSGIAYYPPTTYFQNINFNNDFYAIPNNNQGISLAYADTHFLFSTGVATSMAITTYFSGSVGIGTIASTAGTLNALTINAINAIELNGINISTLYQPIINTYTVSGGTGGSMAFSSGTLTLTLPTSYSSMTINSLTTATSFIYKGTELSTTLATYQPIINTYTVSGGTGGSMAFSSGTLTLTLPTSYSSMTINSLTTATSFIYKGTELSTTLNNYLLLTGGTLTGTLTGTTINATTLQQGGTALNTIITNNLSSYLTALQTSNQFLLLSGGTIAGNLTVNGNAGIGTAINSSYTLTTNTSNVVSGISLSGNPLTNIYQRIINTYTITGATGGSLSSNSVTLTLAMPTNYTGNFSIAGNAGIGTTSSSTNTLFVNGTSYISSNVGIGTTPSSTIALTVNGYIVSSNLINYSNIYTTNALVIGKSLSIYFKC